jgi:PTH1 family peptidyl-tRNA hydrolase
MHYLFVGLGNKGNEYKNTRHNIGFDFVDAFAEKYSSSWSKSKYNSDICDIRLDGVKITLMKPMTYMNESGVAVLGYKTAYKINNSQIYVFHDELDIDFGRIKYKIGGGSAGHKGIKSIDRSIGNDFHRIRYGIGRSQNPNIEVSDYVLSKFSSEEIVESKNIITKFVENFTINSLQNIQDLINFIK